MPIYEYQCPQCGRVFEEWVKLSDAHEEMPCPDCGADAPRLISHTSFVLKGGGWYVTDYGYRKGIKDDSQKPSDSTEMKGSTEAKKETQPSQSSEPKSTPKKSEKSASSAPSAKESTSSAA